MSKYTVQLRYLVEQFESEATGPVPTGQEFHDSTYWRLGLSAYPIFDEAYRHKLNDKIIAHFYMREIGQETAGLFSFMLKRTMNEIMPYYNEFYKRQLELEIKDPLEERGLHVSGTHHDNLAQVSSAETTAKQDTLSENRNVFSDTPMDMLSNAGSPNVENLDYATNVTYDTGHGDSSSTASGRSDRDEQREGGYNRDETGHTRPNYELLYSYLSQFINIDMKVIDELEPLFLQLW